MPLNSVFQALQASLGSYYVNDMNLFGRTWQVQVQAEAADRATHRRHLPHQCAQRTTGKMIPLRSLVEVRIVVGPPALIRYNNLRAVTIQGSPAQGVSSGTGAQRHGRRRGEDAARRAMAAPGPIPRSRRSAPRARRR